MCNNWAKYSILKQILILFSLLLTFSFSVSVIITSIYAYQTHTGISTNSRDYLFNQMKKNIDQITLDGGNILDQMFNKYSSNLINTISVASSDVFRNDYPFGYIKSYYNWPNTFINEFYSNSLHANISLMSSSYNIYNKTPNDILDNSSSYIINRTSSLDLFFIPLFKKNNDFIQEYIGFPSSFQRNYPASINYNNINSYILYNPSDDYWYQNTLLYNDKLVYSSPYFDNIANQSMITISRTINNIANGQIIGVVGADLTLTQISDLLSSIRYLENGRVMLFEKSGLLISDTKKSYSRIVSYSDIYNDIGINLDNWNYLIQDNTLLLINNYYIKSQILSTASNKYILLSFVNYDDVFSQISPLLNRIDDYFVQTLIIVFCVIGGIMILIS